MSDVEKKIDLKFDSNVESIIASVKALSKVQESLADAIKSMHAMVNDNVKKEIAQQDELNKKLEEEKRLRIENNKKLYENINVLKNIKNNLYTGGDVGGDISRLVNIPFNVLDNIPSKLNDMSKDILKKNPQSKKAAVAAGSLSLLASATSLAIQPIKNMAEGISSTTKELLNMKAGLATINTSTSLITNKSARTAQMKYGLSSSQYAGFSQAAQLLNISDEEDFMYMNSSQRKAFNDYTSKFSQMYEKLESSGVLSSIQQMQLDLSVFKQEMSFEFLSWIAKNKDSIMTLMRGIMEASMKVIEGVMGIANWLTGNHGGTSIDANVGQARSVTVNINSNANINNNGQAIGADIAQTTANEARDALLAIL